MSVGLRVARWAWVVSACAVVVLVIRRIGTVWSEATSIGAGPEYFNAVGQYRLSFSQASALHDIGLSPTWHGAFAVVRLGLVAATALAIAALLWRRARTWAPLFLSWFLINGMMMTAFGDDGSEGELPGWLGIPVLLVFVGGVVSLVGLLLVFPDDRSARWVLGPLAVFALIPLFAAISDNDTLGDLMWEYGIYGALIMIGVGLLLQVTRALRSPDRTARELLALTVAMIAIFLAMSFGADSWSGIEGSRRGLSSVAWRLGFETAYMAIPILYGLAVLWVLVRRGHWDMDVRLKGSVGYAGLSTALVLGYFGLVGLVQALLNEAAGTTGSTFAIAISTAVVAAVFLPLRARLQALVDLGFDRRRRDADELVRVFETTSVRAHHPDDVADALLEAVDTAFRPAHAMLWTAEERDR